MERDFAASRSVSAYADALRPLGAWGPPSGFPDAAHTSPFVQQHAGAASAAFRARHR